MQAVREHGSVPAVRAAPLTQLGERYRRYRLADTQAEQAMAQSLARWGQLAPVVVCRREEQWQVVDGFKRLTAARALAWPSLLMRCLEADDERTVILAGGEVEHDGETFAWGTVGIFRISDGAIAECWVVPHDQHSFDQIWSFTQR